MPSPVGPLLTALKARTIEDVNRWSGNVVSALAPILKWGTTRIWGYNIPEPVSANDGQAVAWSQSRKAFDYVTPTPLTPSGVTPGTYGDSTNVGRFAVDVNGIVTAAADVPIAFPAPPAASGWNMSDLPTSPDPRDDEFLTAGLSGWTAVNTLSGTAIDSYAHFSTANTWRGDANTFRPSWFMFQPSLDGSLGGISRNVTLNTNDTLWVRWSVASALSTYTQNNARVEIYIADGTPGVPGTHYIGIAWNAHSSQAVTAYSNAGTVTTLVAGSIGTMPIQGFLINKQATEYNLWALDMNGGWFFCGGFVNVNTFTNITLGGRNVLALGIGSGPGNPILGFDFLRFKANNGKYLP